MRRHLACGWQVDESSNYYLQYYKSLPNGMRITLVKWREGWRDLEWTKVYQKHVNCHGMMYWNGVEGGYSPFPDEVSTVEDAMAFLEVITRMGP